MHFLRQRNIDTSESLFSISYLPPNGQLDIVHARSRETKLNHCIPSSRFNWILFMEPMHLYCNNKTWLLLYKSKTQYLYIDCSVCLYPKYPPKSRLLLLDSFWSHREMNGQSFLIPQISQFKAPTNDDFFTGWLHELSQSESKSDTGQPKER